METKKVFKALLDARVQILGTKVKKEGKNKFSNYDYYTPSQITSLVTDASQKCNLITHFEIESNEGEFVGVLNVISIEDGSSLRFTIPTATPDIKATNVTQKLGGMVTYTERYLNMIAFAITDNNLDLDSQDNSGEKIKKLPKLNDERFEKALYRIDEGTYTKEDLFKNFSLTNEQKAQL